MYGKHHTEESKILMSQNRKGLTTGVNNGNYGNIGDKAKNGKAIYKYLDEEHTVLIQKYNTVSQVLEDLKIKGHSALYKAIKNNKSYNYDRNKIIRAITQAYNQISIPDFKKIDIIMEDIENEIRNQCFDNTIEVKKIENIVIIGRWNI